jgi:hypothetical protein
LEWVKAKSVAQEIGLYDAHRLSTALRALS